MSQRVVFLDPDSVRKALSDDPPRYFSSLTETDKRIRGDGGHDKSSYLHFYLEHIVPFEQKDMVALQRYIEEIDKITRSFKRLHYSVPWKLAKVCCNIENGFPHTHKDIIVLGENFLRNSVELCMEVLIHEKIHVYQRMYPLYTNTLVHNYWKYNLHDMLERYMDARQNPDLNGIVYSRGRQHGCYMRYTQHPTSLNDAYISTTTREKSPCNTEAYEHPLERMAYEVSKLVMNPTLIIPESQDTKAWMETFL
jgi:hypothetical protein